MFRTKKTVWSDLRQTSPRLNARFWGPSGAEALTTQLLAYCCNKCFPSAGNMTDFSQSSFDNENLI